MKAGRSLVELAQEITRQNQSKKDFLLDTRSLEMLPAQNEALALSMIGTSYGSMGIGDIAHRQIGTHLGIPAKYYDKMLREYPELLLQNVNGWFRKEPTKRMVRTLERIILGEDGNPIIGANGEVLAERYARAFLSERYRCIDNYDIAETVLPIIREMPEARVESCEITESRMYLKVVNPRLQTEVVPGDIVQAGIMITNSETGQGSVNVQPLIYRLVCTNGMVVNDAATRRYHIGRGNEADENFELYTDETLKANDKAFMLKIRDTVRSAVDEAKFNRVVDMMREAREAKIVSNDIPAVVELTGKEYGLSKEENDGVLSHLIRNGDLSLYGLANAVTEQSQEVKSYDRATDLEVIGFNVLAMSKALWNRVNAMA